MNWHTERTSGMVTRTTHSATAYLRITTWYDGEGRAVQKMAHYRFLVGDQTVKTRTDKRGYGDLTTIHRNAQGGTVQVVQMYRLDPRNHPRISEA